MPLLSNLSAAGTAFLLTFILLLFLLIFGSGDVRAASLREHRLRGSEPDPWRGTPYMPPNADMLKALEYIENLRQQAGAAPREQSPDFPDIDAADVDDMETLRSMLKLAAPAQTQSQRQPGRDEDGDEEDEEEERESNEEDTTQEWLQALLSTLDQNEKSPRPAPRPNTADRAWTGTGRRPERLEEDKSQVEVGAYPRVLQQYGSSQPHRRYPLLFEDEEEGGEGEKEKQRSSDRESPYKRTNENVEEKYTPQNLATLQSVFEELGRLANGKAGHKRQASVEDDEDEEDENAADDDDMFRVRNLDYDDETGEEDWTPLEGKIRTLEEERDNREEFDQGLENDDDDVDDEEAEKSDDEGNFQLKRSAQSGPSEDPDDITKLVDYYILKVLEKTEEEQQKRELEEEEEEKEEEERAVRRATQSQSIDPQAIYQFIKISQKLQIPPIDLLDMLKSGKDTEQDRIPQINLAQTRMANYLATVEDKPHYYRKYKTPTVILHNRRLPETQASDIPDDINTDDILNILGMGNVGHLKAANPKKHTNSHSAFYAPIERQGDRTLSQEGVPEKIKNDYDDTVDEDELATYLASQMLAQYPEVVKNKANQKRAAQPVSHDEQPVLGTFEQAIQDYFDQMDSDRSQPEKRQIETEDMGGATQTQTLNDAALLKILSFINPETEESEDKDLNGKTVKGM